MALCGLLGIPPLIVGQANDTTTDPANNLAWVTYINSNTSHPDWTLNCFSSATRCADAAPPAAGNRGLSTRRLTTPGHADAVDARQRQEAQAHRRHRPIGDGPGSTAMLKSIGDKIDGIELHDYVYHPSRHPKPGVLRRRYYNVVNAANKGQIGPRIDTAVMYLDKYDPNKRIKIYEDEWGDWVEPLPGGDGWLQQGTVKDAIPRRPSRCTCSGSTPTCRDGRARPGHQRHSFAPAHEEQRTARS